MDRYYRGLMRVQDFSSPASLSFSQEEPLRMPPYCPNKYASQGIFSRVLHATFTTEWECIYDIY